MGGNRAIEFVKLGLLEVPAETRGSRRTRDGRTPFVRQEQMAEWFGARHPVISRWFNYWLRQDCGVLRQVYQISAESFRPRDEWLTDRALHLLWRDGCIAQKPPGAAPTVHRRARKGANGRGISFLLTAYRWVGPWY
jgi:hypothetical protein